MAKDKGFIEEADKLGIDMSPIDSEAILKLIIRVAATPKSVIEHYNTLDQN